MKKGQSTNSTKHACFLFSDIRFRCSHFYFKSRRMTAAKWPTAFRTETSVFVLSRIISSSGVSRLGSSPPWILRPDPTYVRLTWFKMISGGLESGLGRKVVLDSYADWFLCRLFLFSSVASCAWFCPYSDHDLGVVIDQPRTGFNHVS